MQSTTQDGDRSTPKERLGYCVRYSARNSLSAEAELAGTDTEPEGQEGCRLQGRLQAVQPGDYAEVIAAGVILPLSAMSEEQKRKEEHTQGAPWLMHALLCPKLPISRSRISRNGHRAGETGDRIRPRVIARGYSGRHSAEPRNEQLVRGASRSGWSSRREARRPNTVPSLKPVGFYSVRLGDAGMTRRQVSRGRLVTVRLCCVRLCSSH